MDSPKALAVSPATSPGLPGSSTDLSSRAVPKHPGEPDDCFYPCFIAGVRLHPKGRTGHSQLYPFTRPNRFAFATAHEFASPGFAPRIAPTRRWFGYMYEWAIYMVSTSQLTRSARLAWRTLVQGGLQGGFERGNQPTPALRDRVESSQDSTFAPPLSRRGFSKEKSMTTTDSVFQRALSNMLTEIFDGPPGQEAYLLNPGDPGLLRQLDTIDASAASKRPMPGKTTIAAHVDHVHFGLSILNRWAAGEANPWAGADWNASWQRTTVTEDQWRTLRDGLRHEAEKWRKVVATRTNWDDMGAAAALSTAAHTAYHFGAIRQILAGLNR